MTLFYEDHLHCFMNSHMKIIFIYNVIVYVIVYVTYMKINFIY